MILVGILIEMFSEVRVKRSLRNRLIIGKLNAWTGHWQVGRFCSQMGYCCVFASDTFHAFTLFADINSTSNSKEDGSRDILEMRHRAPGRKWNLGEYLLGYSSYSYPFGEDRCEEQILIAPRCGQIPLIRWYVNCDGSRVTGKLLNW